MKKLVFKVDLHDDKKKKKAMKSISSLSGVESIAVAMKDNKLTVVGDIDPVKVVITLRKCKLYVEILSIGPLAAGEKEEEQPKKDEGNKKDKGGQKKGDQDEKKTQEKQVAEVLRFYYNFYSPYYMTQAYPDIAQPGKLSEPLAAGTTKRRVLRRSQPRPLSIAIKRTSRKLASDSNISRFHATDSLSECHSGGQDKDREIFHVLDVSDCSSSKLQWLLERKQADDLYMNALISSYPATGFRAEFLVELRFSGCTIYEQAWLGRQRIGSIRVIDFSHSNLKSLPDLSEAHQARKLILRRCKKLANVSCIGHLAKLEHLDLKGYTNLTGLPSMIHLKLLTSVDLSHCRNLERLPPSIGCLSGLTSLNLRNCERLENLPASTPMVKSLQTLDISGCKNLMKRATAAANEELRVKTSSCEPELCQERSLQSDAGASRSCTANLGEAPCLERTYSRFHPGIEKQAVSPVREELVRTSAMKLPQQLEEREKPDEETVFSQTPSTKVATNSSWHGESSYEGANSATTLKCQDLQEQMDMSVESIHWPADIEELVDAWDSQTSGSQKRSNLKDTMCLLEELKGSVPRTVERMRSAQTCRTSLQEQLTRVTASFIESQGECFALDVQLTMLSDEEAKLDAEIEALISLKEERRAK